MNIFQHKNIIKPSLISTEKKRRIDVFLLKTRGDKYVFSPKSVLTERVHMGYNMRFRYS